MAELTRILVVSDMRGHQAVWRKLANAVSLDLFKVDAALLAGGLGVDREQARAWTQLAAERIGDGSIPLCVIPGVADDRVIDSELSAAGGNPLNVDGRRCQLPGGLALIADSCRSGTTPSLAQRLQALAAEPGPTVLMTAAPPYDAATGTGCRQVTESIEAIGPALSLHGLGATGGQPVDPKRWIGDTLVLTPGSEADRGGLLGFVVDLVGGGVRLARPFQT